MEEKTMNLAGKTAIVSGGGSGIGRGVAMALANQGVRLVVCGRRMSKIQATADVILSKGGQAIPIQADVTSQEDIDRLVNMTLGSYGRIEILINNAGISDEGEIHAVEPASWDRIMATNLRGPFLLSRAVLPEMRQQQSGHIINISSESGIEYYPGDAAYGTSKHALNAFGEFLQRENQDFNIRVNTICPGMVVTEMTENSKGLDHSKCLYPEDIADLVIWLLSRRQNIKIGTPILIQTMLNPWT